ncbi:MAG: aromatic hydrocarbon degradation protein [Bacteroidales bacterium]|nr:aromatic hydrocarbon degradation protein [Bacteroidales bacterium]
MNNKKIAVLLASAALALSAFAEGYQVNTLSARQNGMGHTGVAQHLGAESMIFNPAGLGFLDKAVEFQGSVTGVFADATCTYQGAKFKTDNTPSTPLAFNLGMKVYDNFKVGISFYTPYGSGINWGENWAGAVLNQSVSLKSYTIQPTLSWRILPNLSIGAGAMVTFGSVDLNKGLIPVGSMNTVLAAMSIPYTFTDTPASINLNGKASATVGFNVGAMWDINSKWTVGASFRSKMNLKVKCGNAAVNYANEIAQQVLQNQLDILNQANFTASMPAVAVTNIGVAYKPTDKWLVAFDAQISGWKSYKSLDIDFLSEQLSGYNQHLTKNYRNSWTFKMGAQYDVTKRLQTRIGMMIDTTPVNDEHYNPETPGMTKISPSIGLSFCALKNFAIDFSLLYVAGLGKENASCTYADLLLNQPLTFTASYKVHAWNPSIGFRLSF